MQLKELLLTGTLLSGACSAHAPAAVSARAPVAFSGPKLVSAPGDFVTLPEDLGVVTGSLGRAFVAGPAGLESLDLVTGAVVWQLPVQGLPLAVRGETMLAIVRSANFADAQLVGVDRSGLEVFRSQPFSFTAAMAVRTTAQSDGSELVSWQVDGSCSGGVYVPSCNPRARVRMKIAAVTGHADIQPPEQESASENCPVSLVLREMPPGMQHLAPIPPMVGLGECAGIGNPFLYASMPMMVAGTASSAVLYQGRATADGGEQLPLGSVTRWALTRDGSHLMTYTDDGEAPARGQTLRVYALSPFARILEVRIMGPVSPLVTVSGTQVFYVTDGEHRQLVSAGSHTWSHAVRTAAPSEAPLPRP